ncbi:hypothetical protein J6O57_12215 [Escherichia coli]|nr:hypothetical protein J6O57_12215 [Escherichia coli]UAP59838.1 hypothetical protein J6O05_12210 [Escherichia coli]HBR3033950.1 hypothetical protein [Klebsiella pneumoniae]HBR4168497.1 hypothetical protein [Klebsiella pneumoniae]HBS6596683.1 hypothetical protein [Klebsiella pneumoniae]
MDKPLNKREREFLKPAIVHLWEIEISPVRKTALWDGDSLLPVRVGAMAESLIKRGYLERVSMGFGRDIIRATEKAKNLRCYRCSYGRTIKNGQQAGPCPHCDGGIKPEGANQ